MNMYVNLNINIIMNMYVQEGTCTVHMYMHGNRNTIMSTSMYYM
jgi:hypothetical protein